MNHQPKKWVLKEYQENIAAEISRALDVSRPAAAVMVNRGITSVERANAYLNPDFTGLLNPFLLPDMEKAVGRIRKAVDTGEKILVYGDRDVDGITSICVMVRTLRSLGVEPLWYIPSNEGYGVHKEVIERYSKEGIKLIITVDCGISALEETKYAQTLGIDIVVTDHHEPAAEGLPQAVAVVDPKLHSSLYPFSGLAGCGVSLKVSEALMLSFGRYYNEELIALAINTVDNTIGAVKTRNGINYDSLTFSLAKSADGKEKIEKLFDLIGERRIIAYDEEAVSIFLSQYSKGRQFHIIGVKNNIPVTPSPALAEISAAQTARMLFEIETVHDVRMSFFRENHLDVITLGTIADIVPLLDENRIIVKYGLERFMQSKKVGIQALVEKCLRYKKGALSAKSISWSITPLLNAAGRRGKAGLAAELLLTEDVYRANSLIEDISKLNVERRALQALNIEKFQPLLKEQCDIDNDRLFLVTARGIEHGVTGIVASQLSRQYQRPVVLLIIEGNEAMGAARSYGGFDIVSCFSRMSDILIKYGGHSQAAGLTIAESNLDELRRRIKEIAEKEITMESLVPALEIDVELNTSEITTKFLKELASMEPYGAGNPLPVFCMNGMKVIETGCVGTKNDHIKMRVSKDGSTAFEAVGWGMGHLHEHIRAYPYVDIAFQLELNTWQDKKTIQLLIQDIKQTEII